LTFQSNFFRFPISDLTYRRNRWNRIEEIDGEDSRRKTPAGLRTQAMMFLSSSAASKSRLISLRFTCSLLLYTVMLAKSFDDVIVECPTWCPGKL